MGSQALDGDSWLVHLSRHKTWLAKTAPYERGVMCGDCLDAQYGRQRCSKYLTPLKSNLRMHKIFRVGNSHEVNVNYGEHISGMQLLSVDRFRREITHLKQNCCAISPFYRTSSPLLSG